MILDENIEFRGDLKGFPIEIVQKLLEKQLEQGLKENIAVFEMDIYTSSVNGGFAWDETSEGRSFWYDVLINKDFKLFFTKYPKSTDPKSSDSKSTVKQSLVSLNIENSFNSFSQITQKRIK